MADTLRSSLIKSTTGSGRNSFLPDGELKAILTCSRVKNEVKSYKKFKRQGAFQTDPDLALLVDFVLKNAQKTFAVLILSGNLKLIDILYRQGHDDTKFPFNKGQLRATIEEGLENTVAANAALWEDNEIQDLEPTIDNIVDKWQYCLMAPIFDPGTFKYRLDEEIPLPFCPLDTTSEVNDKGGFGEVRKRLLHHDHIKLTDRTLVCFAPENPSIVMR